VRITTATFYSPKGQTWGKIGLQPDIVVQNGPANLEIGRYDLTADPDLREALRQLQSPSYTQR
jgi:carboxyl-terminal processing protease